MDFDPLLLSRIQFAFVVSFHILFPAFTIGLAWWLVTLEGLWLKTGQTRYRDMYFFWMKIFAVSFGMGVVSGIVMSFQFGTNWSRFSDATGNIMGPLMSYEVLTAFFLEASFLGVMLFGWKRVPPWVHFAATCLVAIGTLISAFWILAANSWMHTPAGFRIEDGIFFPVDWWQIVFNPSFPYRFSHMVLAAFLTCAFVVGGVSAFYLLRDQWREKARIMLKLSVGFILLVAPLQILVGDLSGLNTLEHQPAKVAAMEGHWNDEGPVPLVLFGWPDEDTESNHFQVAIPYLGSLILTHSLNEGIAGLTDFPEADRPPVLPVFWSFRVMVGIGLLMLLAGVWGGWLWWRGRLSRSRLYLRYLTLLTPAGFIAILAGWFTTEIGRQPFVVYGLLRTSEGHSPVPAESILLSLAIFMVVYLFIFSFGSWYLIKLLLKGPVVTEPEERDQDETPLRPISVPDEPAERGV